MKQRLMIGLVALLVMLSGVTPPVEAQTLSLSSTASPPLLLIIVLDDSSTMQGTNTITTIGTFRATPARNPTDGNDERAEAVRHILDLLASDQQAEHRVAVLSFDFSTLDWLSAVPQTTEVFIPLGGAVADTDAGYQNLLTALADTTRRRAVVGPGDVGGALELAHATLTTQLENISGYKPAIVVIADDVPMSGGWRANGSSNPWFEDFRSRWVGEMTTLNNTLGASLPQPLRYEGFCAMNNGGGIPVVPLALGAANWFAMDGTFLEEPGVGDYYEQLARATGALIPGTSTPLHYPIDSELDDPASELRANLLEGAAAAVRGLRCAQEPAGGQPQAIDITVGDKQYVLPVSAFYAQLRLIVTMPTAGTTQIDSPGGLDITGRGRVSRAADGRREVWTFLRADFGEDWLGQWRVTVPIEAQVTFEVEADLETLLVTVEQDQFNNQDLIVPIRLSTGGLPLLADDALLAPLGNSQGGRVAGTLTIGSEQIRRDFRAAPGQPQLLISEAFGGSDVPNGSYRLQMDIALLPGFSVPGVTTRYSGPLPGNINVNNTEEIAIELDPDDPDWRCTEQLNGNPARLVGVNLPRDYGQETEGLYAYTIMELYYPDSPASGATPVAQLRWDGQSRRPAYFTGLVDCTLLSVGEAQSFWINVILPEQPPTPYMQQLNWQPSETPTPTATYTPTATPTPTSTPPPPTPTLAPAQDRPVTNQVSVCFAEGNPCWVLTVVGGGLVALLVGIQGLRALLRTAPLWFVRIIRDQPDGNGDAKPQRVPVLGWRQYVWPFARRAAIREGSTELFSLRAADQRLQLQAGSNPVWIEGQTISPNQTTTLTGKRTEVVVNQKTYIILNYRATR